MTVTVATGKKVEGAKYGITFSRKTPTSPLTVRELREESPFNKQGLRPGMIVTRINGEDMTWEGPKDAARALQKAKVGSLMSVEAADSVAVSIRKASRDAKLGIWLRNSSSSAGVFVSRINKDSIFASSNLKPGMRVIKINDTTSFGLFQDAVDTLKAAEGIVKIIAIDSLAPITKKTTKKPSILKQTKYSKTPDLEETSSDDESSYEEAQEESRTATPLLDSMMSSLILL